MQTQVRPYKRVFQLSKSLVCAALLVCLCMPVSSANAAEVTSLWIAKNKHSFTARQALYLSKYIEQRLPNLKKVAIKTEPADLSEQTLLDHIRDDQMPMAILGNSVIDEVPRLSIFRIPWGFRSQDHVQEALYAGLEDAIRTEVEERLGLVVIGVYANAFHNIRANDTFFDISQYKKRKMAVSGGRSLMQLMNSLGAQATPYSKNEIMAQLENAQIDSVGGQLDELLSLPIGTDLPIISLTEHVYEPTFFVASKKFWLSLSDADRGILTEVGVDFSETAMKLALAHQDALQKNIPTGIHLKLVSSDPFIEISAKYRAQYAEKYGEDWLEFMDIGFENSF